MSSDCVNKRLRVCFWYMIATISIADEQAFEKAFSVIQQGGTLVYPTETCYGLGCDARNTEAVDRVFRVKERDPGKPVLIIASSVAMLMEYVEWNETIDDLARTYWPGPLTLVSSLKNGNPRELAPGVIGVDDTVAFRVTSHPFAAKLAETLGAPIVSTSANLSAHANPYDINYMINMFEGRDSVPDLIVDAGNLPHHSPSTIVKVDDDGTKTILRHGEIIVE